MKKICFVLTAEFALKAFMLEHIKILSKDFDVSVIVNTKNPNFFDEFDINARIVPLNVAREINLLSDIISLFKLIRIFRANNYDAVHTVTPKAGLLGMLAAFLSFTKIRVHTFQGEVWITKKGILRLFLICLDKLVSLMSTHLIVVSKSEQEFLIKHKIINFQKSIVFNHGSIAGVDIERFKPDVNKRNLLRAELDIADNDIVCLFVGRINKDKGILDLVKAFSLMTSSKCHLMIIGPDEHNLKDLVESELLQKKHLLHIFPETATPEQYMVASDILCLPSYREGFGVVLIEAAACGVTSIASRIYGITDAVVENETGLLHEPRNILDIKDKIETLVSNDQLRSELSMNALKRAIECFDNKLLTQSWLNFYKKLLFKID